MNFFPMMTLSIKNLFSRPATRLYPFKVRKPFDWSRGRILIDFPACIFCNACAKHCPAGSITVDREKKSWTIDRFSCVTCAACIRACPKKCLSMGNERPTALPFADSAGRLDAHLTPPQAPSSDA